MRSPETRGPGLDARSRESTMFRRANLPAIKQNSTVTTSRTRPADNVPSSRREIKEAGAVPLPLVSYALAHRLFPDVPVPGRASMGEEKTRPRRKRHLSSGRREGGGGERRIVAPPRRNKSHRRLRDARERTLEKSPPSLGGRNGASSRQATFRAEQRLGTREPRLSRHSSTRIRIPGRCPASPRPTIRG